MVCHLPSGYPGLLGLRNDLEVGSHLGGAGGKWLGGAFDLDEAHSAVTGN